MIEPKEVLLNGVAIVSPLLNARGFRFHFGQEGTASGGHFACAQFAREDRRLELHFRHSLGLVAYHVADQVASHEWYMRELGAWDECRYPGFSTDPLDAFRDLAHDLNFAEDFLAGSAEVLRRAAGKQRVADRARNEETEALYAGDSRTLEALKAQFLEARYEEVLALAAQLKYPQRLTKSATTMIEIAGKRLGKASPGR